MPRLQPYYSTTNALIFFFILFFTFTFVLFLFLARYFFYLVSHNYYYDTRTYRTNIERRAKLKLKLFSSRS